MIDAWEIVWTVISGTGAVAAVRLFLLAQGDLVAIRDTKAVNGRVLLAKMNRRFGAILAVVLSWNTILGILAFTQPPPRRTGLGWFTLIVFIGMQALFVTGLLLNLRDRKRFNQAQ